MNGCVYSNSGECNNSTYKPYLCDGNQECRFYKITSFFGEFRFLSNFYESDIVFEDLHYGSVEVAFQAQKTLDVEDRMRFTRLSPSQAKSLGRKINLRPDWDLVKDEIMFELCSIKFSKGGELAERLLATGNAELIEGNTWGDIYWGVCNGVGKNMLGRILMDIRANLNRER